MESLITFLLILLISALATWLKRLGQKRAEKSSGASRRALPGTQERKTTNWEDELRRLLGEEEAPMPPPQAPPPPPVVARPKPPPQAQPPPAVLRAPVPEVTPLPVPTVEQITTAELARLEESRRAYERAGNLDRAVAEYLKKVSSAPVRLTSVLTYTSPSPEVTQAVSLLKNPRAAREAIVASVILGPPKALEQI